MVDAAAADLTTPAEPRALPHLGTYRRELPVSIERIYENALDWEHLPWLHRSSFRSIECLASSRSSWRARVGLRSRGRDGGEAVIELSLDRECRRWITRTVEGEGAGTEIWTHAFSEGSRRTDVVVDFFVPGVATERRAAVGAGYAALYARLYDEDVWMMTERQARLDHRGSGVERDYAPIVLGPIDEVLPRVPFRFEAGRHEYRVVQIGGELVAHAVVCPHLLGPLGDAPVIDGVVECPWHGYRFDVRTGESCSGQRCRLPPAPNVHVDDVRGQVVATWNRPPT